MTDEKVPDFIEWCFGGVGCTVICIFCLGFIGAIGYVIVKCIYKFIQW